MDLIELYLNDLLTDLPEGVGRLLRMSKPGTDAAALGSRGAETSYTLTLDYTRQNDRIFAHHRDPQTTDKFAPAAPYVARLYVNGNLFFRGLWQLTSIKNGYAGKLVSEEVDVFSAIGTKSLQELRFAPFGYQGRHGFDERLKLSPADTDVQFPLVAYGNFYQPGAGAGADEQTVPASASVAGAAPLEVDDYLPSVSFVRTLRRIFADVGWQIRGEVLAENDVAQAMLPYTGSQLPWNWGELLKVRADGGISSIAGAFTPDFDFLSERIPTPGAVSGGSNAAYWALQPTGAYNPAGRLRGVQAGATLAVGDNGRREAYTVRLDGGYRLQCELEVLELSGGAGAELQWRRMQAGQTVEEGEVLLATAVPGPGLYQLDTDVLSQNGLFLETGQYVLATVVHPNPPAGFRLAYGRRLVQVDPREPAWPVALDVAQLLPAMSQLDFVRGFVLARNLRFTTDAEARVITFHYRQRYELPAALAVDLSDRCDPEAGEYTPALPARRIVLGFAEDEADALLSARKGFADVVYEPKQVPTGVETAEARYLLPWAPTVRREYRGVGDARALLPCLATAEALATPLNEVASSTGGFAARVLVYQGPAPAEEQLFSFAFRGAGQTSYGKAEFTRGWWFSGGASGLYERHYAGLFEELLRGHRLKLPVALTPGLYAQLSPAHPVRLGTALYRLGGIPAFAVGGEGDTELSLLRIVPVAGPAIGVPPLPATAGQVGEFEAVEYYEVEFY